MAEPADKEVRLAEFRALRDEIAQRSTFQQAIVGLNLTALAAILGLAIGRSSPEVVDLIPMVSSTLGLLWLDHHRNIQRIAAYVRDNLWIWEPSWETYRQSLPRRGDGFYFWAVGVLFLLAGIAATTYTVFEGLANNWLLAIGAVFVVVYAIDLVRVLRHVGIST